MHIRHRQKLTFRIGLDTVDEAIARVKQRRKARNMLAFVRRSGFVSIRLNTQTKYRMGPVLHGRLRPDGKGLVLTGTIRESWSETTSSMLMWIPAGILTLAAIALTLTGTWIPLVICVPGAAALGALGWKIGSMRSDSFESDAGELTRVVRELLR